MFELDAAAQQVAIKVIGVGGGGGNAVEHMIEANLEGIDFINANTDDNMLGLSGADTVLLLGEDLVKGLGAGSDPEVGRLAAVEDRERIATAIDGADILFITAGMGGGTGTGSAPVIAELARKKGILTVAIVTRPFLFEGKKRHYIANQGLEELKSYVDALIVIPNEKVFAVMGQNATMIESFDKANEFLFNAVQGISELITRPSFVSVNFADIKSLMSDMGMMMMGSATASGENRAIDATQQAISSPFLEGANLHDAKGLLVNITAGQDMAIGEFEAIDNAIHEYATEDAEVVMGIVFDPTIQSDIRVTIYCSATVVPAQTEELNMQTRKMQTRKGFPSPTWMDRMKRIFSKF